MSTLFRPGPLHRPGRLRRWGALAVALVTAAGLTACSPSSSSTSSAQSITLAAFPNGNSLDPWGSQVSNYTQQATYDTLTRLKTDGTIGPWLATSWQYTDTKTLVLKLRSGVKFTDGTVFDASAVKANLEYGKKANPKNMGSAAFVGDIDSVTVVDSSTVKINLIDANPDMPWAFSQQAGWMVSPKALASPASLTFGAVGTGPYVFDKAASVAQQTYTFTKNPSYWADAEAKRFDQVTIKIMGDPNAMANAARTGAVDFLITPDPTVKVANFTKSYGSAVTTAGLVIEDLQGKLTKGLGDVRVRQALNYAIDRQSILKNVLHGAGVVNASVPFSASSDGYTSAIEDYYTYDPAKAKQLLADAGYATGLSLNILINAQFATLAQAIAGYLRTVGVKVTLSAHSTDITEQTQSGKWAIASIQTGVNGQPFSDITNLMTDVSIFNPQRHNDSTIKRYLQQAAATTSAAAKTKVYTELGTYAASQAWFITPVLLKTGYAYNGKKIVVNIQKGVNAPDLYTLSPAA